MKFRTRRFLNISFNFSENKSDIVCKWLFSPLERGKRVPYISAIFPTLNIPRFVSLANDLTNETVTP